MVDYGSPSYIVVLCVYGYLGLQVLHFVLHRWVIPCLRPRVVHAYGFRLVPFESIMCIMEDIIVGTHLDPEYHFVNDPPLVLDCGMNIGDFALVMKRQWDAEVHGFEPLTEVANVAIENLKLNDMYPAQGVHVVNAAVGPENGLTSMRVRKYMSEMASMVPADDGATGNIVHHNNDHGCISRVSNRIAMAASSLGLLLYKLFLFVAVDFSFFTVNRYLSPRLIITPGGGEGNGSVPLSSVCVIAVYTLLFPLSIALDFFTQPYIEQNNVRVLRLGDYMDSRLKDRIVDLLKIDIEGYAFEALQGLDEKHFSRIKHISIEVEHGRREQEIRELLNRYGFRIYERGNACNTKLFGHDLFYIKQFHAVNTSSSWV